MSVRIGYNGQRIESYVNRQGNEVEIVYGPDGDIKSIDVSGSGSNRAFWAQIKAARQRAQR